MFSSEGDLSPPKRHLATSRDIFCCHSSGSGTTAMHGVEPGMLFSIPQCPEQPISKPRIIQPTVSVVLRLRNPKE